jgi:HEPN domain-containing protein
MKPATAERVRKAEWDFLSAQREGRRRQLPNRDLICFLSQQCVEKYLKALLVENALGFPRIHDLEMLLDLSLPAAPHLEKHRAQLAWLTDHAVEFRYPGETATKEVAAKALSDCRAVRREIRKLLRLDEPPSSQLTLIKEKRSHYRVGRPKKSQWV